MSFSKSILMLVALCWPFSSHGGETGAVIPGTQGSLVLPLEMPADGTITIALYTPEGRLIRPLAQAVELKKGRYTARWDGMDLWGHLLPEGTEVRVKVIHGPGLKALWEFGIASPNPVPWPTKPVGEGEALRAGGWLGDHGVSSAAVAVGPRIYFGSTMAEHGHTVIFCNLEGEKMWGRGGLDGWVGPSMLASDGRAVYGVVKDNQVHRLELDGSSSARIAETKENRVLAIAAHAGKVLLVLNNQSVSGSVVETKLGHRDFVFADCLPPPPNDKAYNRNLTGQEQFSSTFFSGGHPQTGIPLPGSGSQTGILARFRNPVPVGTLLVERLPVPVKAEFYILKPGTSFTPAIKPKPGEAPGPEWVLLGQSGLERRLNTVTAATTGLATEAIYIRIQSADGTARAKWPRLAMCRILPGRLERTDPPATLLPQTDIRPEAPLPGTGPQDTAWSLRAPAPLTDNSPATVVVDYAKPVTFDAIALLNCPNHEYHIDAWTDPSSPPDAGRADKWRPLHDFASATGKLGSASASLNTNDIRISLAETAVTRALRFRFTQGRLAGRWNNPANSTDPSVLQAADVALLRLVSGRPKEGKMILQRIDGKTGAVELVSNDVSVDMTELAFGPDGTLWSVADKQLCQTTLPGQDGGAVRHKVFNRGTLRGPSSLAVSPDGTRIAVGDDEANAVFVFDATGKLLFQIGDGQPRREGPWNGMTVDQPGGLTFDQLGKIWVCERTYTPKRITRYSPNGRFEKEFLGPPHYGGGGAISTDLKSFWYELGEYAVDFENGTSRLVALNDVMSDPDSPSTDGSSYGYTKAGNRPVDLNGRRYLVGDPGRQYSPSFTVSIYDPASRTVKPAAMLGSAEGNRFLLREDKPWHTHWLSQDLKDSSFIWCDLNGDGVGQIGEVDLFKNTEVMGPDNKKSPFAGAYWGTFAGPDLTLWTAVRAVPSRFTAQGVPVYERKALKPFDYSTLAPVYMGNLRHNSSASGGYSGVSTVTRNGSLIFMGQPYVVKPDMTIADGPVSAKPSGIIPPIAGTIIDNPLSFVGTAETGGEIREVAMINGNNGRWFLWAVDEAVLIGEIFTGKAGGFGGITAATRGMDLTHNKNDWETFFGYFTKADNGNYYTISGRGHFGLCRITGINDFKVATSTVTVTAESIALNTPLRDRLAGAGKTKFQPKKLTLPPLAQRAPSFAADGRLDDWGGPEKLQFIDKDAGLRFDAAWDNQDLVLAYAGRTRTENQSEDWRYLFKTGFCFDVMIRPNAKSGEKGPVAGDRRVVFGRHKGRWIAVLYDYVAAGDPGNTTVVYDSPVSSTRVDRVVLVPDDAVEIAFHEAPGTGLREWTAEVRIDWSQLAVKPGAGGEFRADFGILAPDSGGTQIEKRTYWCNPDTVHVADLAVEAEIQPTNWGYVVFGKP